MRVGGDARSRGTGGASHDGDPLILAVSVYESVQRVRGG
jgi:hypothetical protein